MLFHSRFKIPATYGEYSTSTFLNNETKFSPSFGIEVFSAPFVISIVYQLLSILEKKIRNYRYFFTLVQYFIILEYIIQILYHTYIIRLSGDVELNPGPRPNSCQSFSVCHWNLNSITAHIFLKLFLLKAYNAIYSYDIICLSETYLDSETLSGDDHLALPGYNLIRAAHPSNQKRGGTCIYYKNCLPIILNKITYLKECVNLELIIEDKRCNIVSLY